MKMQQLGEFGLIDRIRKMTSVPDPSWVGIGDDCAVIPLSPETGGAPASDLLVSTDMLVEGTHFLMEDISPRQLGWKSAAVNISDIAAMGGKPIATFLSLALPKTLPEQWMQEFIEQANILYDKLPLFGVKCIRKTGWEGDDIIYGMSQSLKEFYPEDKIVIVSTDEDFHQLIGNNIDLYSPIKQILYTLENYEELMGIPQDLFLTYKVLKGDSSDGIGGIPGIGEKTAKSLVNQYGNLEKLLSKDSKDKLMKSKRTQKIFTSEGLQILSRNNQLINLKDYVDLNEIKEEIEETLNKEPFVDTKIAKDFLMKYQITSILVKWKQWIETFEECTNNYLS